MQPSHKYQLTALLAVGCGSHPAERTRGQISEHCSWWETQLGRPVLLEVWILSNYVVISK